MTYPLRTGFYHVRVVIMVGCNSQNILNIPHSFICSINVGVIQLNSVLSLRRTVVIRYMGDVSYQWERLFSLVSRLITWPLETKFDTDNDHFNTCSGTKIDLDRFMGFVCPMWWICSFYFSLFIILISSTARKRGLIWTVDDVTQTTRFDARKCHFGISTTTNSCRVYCSPKTIWTAPT